jgi:integrase
MASIVPRNGKYAVVSYEGDDRTPVWKSGLTYAQAEKLKERKTSEEKKWREQKRKERKSGKSNDNHASATNAGENPTDATVEEFMEDFIIKYGTKHWGDSYFSSGASRMNNYVYPYFGHHRVVDVTTQMIDEYYDFLINKCVPVANRGNKKNNRVSAALVRDIHKVLRTAFNQARRWKNIRANPFLDADVPEHKAKERPAFSPEEFERILRYTDEPDDYERYTLHVALSIQYHCTTRGGEVGALQWPDYNPIDKKLHIYKTLDRVEKKNLNLPKLRVYYTFPVLNLNNKTLTVLKSPKTDAAVRYSELNGIMIERLDNLRAMQRNLIETVFGASYQDNQLIICQPNGHPIMPEQLNRKFKAIIVEMRENGHEFRSVPERLQDEVVFHSVRAASATKKLKASGGNINAVKIAGGWATADMVIKYSKTYVEDQVSIASQMEEDYLNLEQVAPLSDAEKLQRMIRDNPELASTILSTIPALT